MNSVRDASRHQRVHEWFLSEKREVLTIPSGVDHGQMTQIAVATMRQGGTYKGFKHPSWVVRGGVWLAWKASTGTSK